MPSSSKSYLSSEASAKENKLSAKSSPPSVVVAMSGGIDSSVAAALLKQQGYNVIGIYMLFWFDNNIEQKKCSVCPENKCCSKESLERARKIAAKLKIPFYVYNVRQEFKRKIVDTFLQGYKSAKTPNPCIECNRHIKFGSLLNKTIKLGADYLATGHYIKLKKIKNNYHLFQAKDQTKDQSYFLYTLNQKKLKHLIFPLGDYLKSEIKEIAKKFKLKELTDLTKAKESQDLCFYPEKNCQAFLKRHLNKKNLQPGPIKNTDGKIIGRHEGLPLYTIGQRKGLNLGGSPIPLYAIKFHKQDNSLIIGQKKELLKKSLILHQLSFISEKIPDKLRNIDVKIRYQAKTAKANLLIKNHLGYLTFKSPQSAITPGQSAVFYKGKELLGGGIIR